MFMGYFTNIYYINSFWQAKRKTVHQYNPGQFISFTWMFPKIGGTPPKWMVKKWKTLFFNGWFGGILPTIFGNIHLNSSQFGAPGYPDFHYLFWWPTRGSVTINCSPSSNCPTAPGSGPKRRVGGQPAVQLPLSEPETLQVRKPCVLGDVGSGSWVGTNIPIRFKMNSNSPFWRDSFKSLFFFAVMSILHSHLQKSTEYWMINLNFKHRAFCWTGN